MTSATIFGHRREPRHGKRWKPVGGFVKPVLIRMILASVLMTSAAQAQEYRAIGVGTMSCGSWTAARRTQGADAFALQQWVAGFLSGIGYQGPGNPLNGVDAEGVWAWIDNYCRSHPLDKIRMAAEAFDTEHPR